MSIAAGERSDSCFFGECAHCDGCDCACHDDDEDPAKVECQFCGFPTFDCQCDTGEET